MFDGSTLRNLRRSAGLTQVEVAARAGIPSTVLSAYERGCRTPSVVIAEQIVEAMGYSVRFVRQLDPHQQSARLIDVLSLGEALPYRPRPLAKARLR